MLMLIQSDTAASERGKSVQSVRVMLGILGPMLTSIIPVHLEEKGKDKSKN